MPGAQLYAPEVDRRTVRPMATTKMAIRMHEITEDLERMREADRDTKADARKDDAITRGFRRLAEKILAAP